jgi:hypothetical protein
MEDAELGADTADESARAREKGGMVGRRRRRRRGGAQRGVGTGRRGRRPGAPAWRSAWASQVRAAAQRRYKIHRRTVKNREGSNHSNDATYPSSPSVSRPASHRRMQIKRLKSFSLMWMAWLATESVSPERGDTARPMSSQFLLSGRLDPSRIVISSNKRTTLTAVPDCRNRPWRPLVCSLYSQRGRTAQLVSAGLAHAAVRRPRPPPGARLPTGEHPIVRMVKHAPTQGHMSCKQCVRTQVNLIGSAPSFLSISVLISSGLLLRLRLNEDGRQERIMLEYFPFIFFRGILVI